MKQPRKWEGQLEDVRFSAPEKDNLMLEIDCIVVEQ